MKAKTRFAAAATMFIAGAGLAGFGAAAAQATPAQLPEYHWCPGQFFNPGWGQNWDAGRCHDDFYGDGEPHDQGHWHGNGPWRPF